MSDNIQSAFLISDTSPRKAFYNLILTGNKVLKVSGATYPEKKVLDKRVMSFRDSALALAFFERKLREKKRQNRARVYRSVEEVC